MRRLRRVLHHCSVFAVSLPLLVVTVPLALAGGGKISFGGTVQEIRTLPLAQTVTSADTGREGLEVGIRAPGRAHQQAATGKGGPGTKL